MLLTTELPFLQIRKNNVYIGWFCSTQSLMPIITANAGSSVTLTYVEVGVVSGSEACSVWIVERGGSHPVSYTVKNVCRFYGKKMSNLDSKRP